MTTETKIDPLAAKDEFEILNRKLLAHNRGDEILPDDEYRTALRRSLEIVGSMNTTISTPTKNKKGAGKAAKAAPLSLDDL